MNTIVRAIIAAALAAALWSALPAMAQPAGRGRGGKPLTPEANQALIEALSGPEGEYAAHAFYNAVIAQFGPVQPYTAIRAAEMRHIQALKRQLDKYGIPVPSDTFSSKTKAPGTLAEAAALGVESEKKNIAMYERLLAAVKDYPDLTRVFTNLQRASREGHLVALKAAAESGGQLDGAKMKAQISQCEERVGKGMCQRFCWPEEAPGAKPEAK